MWYCVSHILWTCHLKGLKRPVCYFRLGKQLADQSYSICIRPERQAAHLFKTYFYTRTLFSWSCLFKPGLGICSSVFWANRSISAQKWANRSFFWATWAIHSRSLIFSEQPERIFHGRSFLVSDLSNSLTSLIFGERPEQFEFAHIAHQKRGNKRIC